MPGPGRGVSTPVAPEGPGAPGDGDGVRVERLVGVYHASGTWWGELSYWVKARLGGGHCALCEITHGSIREKPAWRRCRAEVPVPVVTVHLDERDDALASFTEGRTPCVVAETTGGPVILVDAEQLAACGGSPQRLLEAITANAATRGLELG